MGDLIGCDFSSSPSARKPIVVAYGAMAAGRVRLDGFERFHRLEDFGGWLSGGGDWVGGFDFPFGLARELVLHLGWPVAWEACVRHFASLSRAEIRDLFAGFCSARPAGRKFAHRATDRPAGSSPSMKWVNPPVAFMMHAGVPLLIDAGVHLAGLRPEALAEQNPQGRARRVAVEAYPGMLAREVLGHRSYKSDDKAKQTAQRRSARAALLQALEAGATRVGLRLQTGADLRESMVTDASGDTLDAAICLLQAAWASRAGWPWFGLPPDLDPLEGWVVGAGAEAVVAPPLRPAQ